VIRHLRKIPAGEPAEVRGAQAGFRPAIGKSLGRRAQTVTISSHQPHTLGAISASRTN